MEGSTGGRQRFRVGAELGRGGLGVVFRAWDGLLEDDVALKRVRDATPDETQRLREEFRVVRRLVHPNLVTPWELFEAGDESFFTMPLVRGVPLDAWVAATADATVEARLARLRRVLPGLLAGIAALHDDGVVHGDLKPSNVLVEDDEARILDFGLSSRLGAADGSSGGSLPYMAPEVLLGDAPTPASDVFSLGVVLWQCLVGDLPWDDGDRRPLAGLPRQRVASSGLPPAIGDLVARALETSPAARPSLAEVARSFGLADDPSTGTRTRARRFFGRGEELDRLTDALARARAGGPVVACIRGASGMGKTALLARFVEPLRPGALVLEGTCDPREGVAFGGLSAAIDGLVRSLRRDRRLLDAVDPVDLAVAAPLFPVLAALPGADVEAPSGDPDERRVRATAALRRVLAAVGRIRPPVVLLDDVQWASEDTRALLVALLDAPGTRALWVIAGRPGADVATPPGVERIDLELGPLGDDELAAIAREVGIEVDDPAAWRRATEGSPFLASTLARLGAAPALGGDDVLDAAVAEAVAQMPADARDVVELAAVADAELPRAVLLAAAHLPARGRVRLYDLEGSGWLATQDVAGDGVAIYHARLGEAVRAGLSERGRVARHLALHDALRRHGGPPALLYRHALGGALPADAATHAVAAGEAANAGLAFAEAAAWFRRALALDVAPEPETLWVRLAEAEVDAGRAVAAAEAWLEAVARLEERGQGDDPRAHRWRSEAATHLVRAGRFDRGDALFAEALAAVGERLPGNGLAAQLEGVWHRLWVLASPRPRAVREAPGPRVRRRLELLREAGFAYAISVPFRADTLHLRALRGALRAGDAREVARGLGQEGSLLAAFPSPFLARRGEAMLALGHELSADDDAACRANLLGGETSVAWSRGRWRRSIEASVEAERLFVQRTRGTRYEVGIVRIFGGSARWWTGDLAELARLVAPWREEARALGDTLQHDSYRVGEFGLAHLALDAPGQLLADAAEIAAREADGLATTQRYMRVHGQTLAHLYEGDPDAARRLLDAEWPGLEKGLFTAFAMPGAILATCRGRVAIALAAGAGGDERRRRLREAAASVVAIRKKVTNRSAPALADLIESAALRLAGDEDGAVARLRRGAAAADDGELGALAAAARALDPDADVAAAGRRDLAARGVADVDRMLRCLVPGWGPEA